MTWFAVMAARPMSESRVWLLMQSESEAGGRICCRVRWVRYVAKETKWWNRLEGQDEKMDGRRTWAAAQIQTVQWRLASDGSDSGPGSAGLGLSQSQAVRTTA